MKKQFTPTCKSEVARELLRGEEKTIAQIGSEWKMGPTQLNQWKQFVLNGLVRLCEDRQREIEQVKKQNQIEKWQSYAETKCLTSEMS